MQCNKAIGLVGFLTRVGGHARLAGSFWRPHPTEPSAPRLRITFGTLLALVLPVCLPSSATFTRAIVCEIKEVANDIHLLAIRKRGWAGAGEWAGSSAVYRRSMSPGWGLRPTTPVALLLGSKASAALHIAAVATRRLIVPPEVGYRECLPGRLSGRSIGAVFNRLKGYDYE
jgi:hypothetical protein